MVSPIGSFSSAALSGIQSATQRFAKGAADVTANGDVSAGVVDMAAAKIQMSASITVARASDSMMGTLLNMLA